jgi:hypothetical protein
MLFMLRSVCTSSGLQRSWVRQLSTMLCAMLIGLFYICSVHRSSLLLRQLRLKNWLNERDRATFVYPG